MRHVSVFHVVRLPSVGLRQHQSASLAVYALCPSAHPAAPAVAQLLVAACLAPCLPEVAAADTAVQPSGSAMKHDVNTHGVQHASPEPVEVLPATAGAEPLQTVDSCPSRQPSSSQVAAGSQPPVTFSAAAAQHDTSADRAPSARAVAAPSTQAVAKYHGAALQTHTLKDAATAANLPEAGPHVQPAECGPVDVAVQVRQMPEQLSSNTVHLIMHWMRMCSLLIRSHVLKCFASSTAYILPSPLALGEPALQHLTLHHCTGGVPAGDG